MESLIERPIRTGNGLALAVRYLTGGLAAKAIPPVLGLAPGSGLVSYHTREP
jgi:hypothetical protein